MAKNLKKANKKTGQKKEKENVTPAQKPKITSGECIFIKSFGMAFPTVANARFLN